MTASSKRNRARLMGGAATTLVLLLAGAGVAQAQGASSDDAATVDEVIVTGIRAGIENSIAVKKKEASIVEVVSAEDIGKLPDMSIAESIARLPGITAQRLNGRAQVISVRGLSPDFTTALLNGREQVSAGDNRGVEFDQYPSELLGSVVIYKTPDAALIGQGMAGTADMRTISPLDFGHRAFAVNARYEWNDIGALNSGTEDHGHRVSVSYVDQFMDGKVGLVLGYSNMGSPYQAERFNAWGYPNADANNLVIGGAKPYVQSSNLERDGYLAIVEFRPNDRIRSEFDAFYSEFNYTEILRGIELPLYWSAAQLQPGYKTANGMVTSGTFNDVKGVVRNDANTRDSTLTSFGWNTQVELNDAWSVELDLNHSAIERRDLILETNAGTGRAGSGATDDMGFVTTSKGTTFSSKLDYADFNLIKITSAQGWGGDVIPGGQVGYYNSPAIEDELNAIRVGATRKFDGGPISQVEFGANLTKREKSLRANHFYLAIDTDTKIIPEAFRRGTTSLGFLGIDRMIAYDPIALVNSGFFDMVRNPNGDVRSQDWHVEEEVLTSYVKADLDTMVGDIPLTGNFGLQVVKTDQSSDAFAATGSGAGTITVPVKGGADYTELLPSLNLSFKLPADQVIRVGAARTLARPRMDEMRASFNYSYDAGKAGQTDINASPWSGGGGNPELKPWIARAYDVAYEKYFGRKGYVSLALFYKDLETYIYEQKEIYDFTGFPVGAVEPKLRQGYINTKQNGDGGVIKGAELAVNVPLDLLHPVLDGFGVTFSASKTESEIEPNGPGKGKTPLPGLSENVVNTTVYYEKNGFQARASSRYRSDFLGEVAAFGNARGNRMVDAENVIDAQIGYQFQSGPLEGASVLFQVNNLTDEEFSTFEGDGSRVIDYQRYGRTYLLGVNYRF